MINRPIHGGYPDVAKGKATLRAVPPTKENPMSDAPAAPTLGEGVIGHRMHALHESAVAADEAREFLAATMEPQFPIEAEMARKGLHFILPASWAVEAIQSALESQSAEIAFWKAQAEASTRPLSEFKEEFRALTAANARIAELEEADRQNSELLEAAVEGQSYWQARNARLTEALRKISSGRSSVTECALIAQSALLDAQPEQGVGK